MQRIFAVSAFLVGIGVGIGLTVGYSRLPQLLHTPAASTPKPTLAFKEAQGLSAVTDVDAFLAEEKMQKRLPGNQFVGMQREVHEEELMQQFMDGFKNQRECDGITFRLKAESKADFLIKINVDGHDTPGAEPNWVWILTDARNPNKAEMGGMGTQSSGALTAKDVCLTVWDDIDPNHFKTPGGRVE